MLCWTHTHSLSGLISVWKDIQDAIGLYNFVVCYQIIKLIRSNNDKSNIHTIPSLLLEVLL